MVYAVIATDSISLLPLRGRHLPFTRPRAATLSVAITAYIFKEIILRIINSVIYYTRYCGKMAKLLSFLSEHDVGQFVFRPCNAARVVIAEKIYLVVFYVHVMSGGNDDLIVFVKCH